MKRALSLILLLVMFFTLLPATHAQGGNLVLNSDMEGGFSSRDGVTGVPLHWAFKKLSGNLEADRQTFSGFARSQPSSWTMRGAYSSFIAAGYQKVNVTVGTVYRMEAFVYIWTCNNNTNSCINENGRFSQKESGMRVRIGLDPVGGDDPQSVNIVWGPWIQPFDQLAGTTIDATAKTGQMTVFLYAESGQAMAFNEVYWDDVTLVPMGVASATPVAGAAAQAGAVVAPSQPLPPSNFVPFVSPQQARPDGSVVHVVRPQDTFDSIVNAYVNLGVGRDAIMQANNLRFAPQYIQIGQEFIILPPGSVDPATGQLLSLTGGAVLPSQQTTAPQPVAVQPTVAPIANPVAQPNAAPSLRTLTTVEISALPALEPIQPFIP